MGNPGTAAISDGSGIERGGVGRRLGKGQKAKGAGVLRGWLGGLGLWYGPTAGWHVVARQVGRQLLCPHGLPRSSH